LRASPAAEHRRLDEEPHGILLIVIDDNNNSKALSAKAEALALASDE
jgi:hypothetical protein